MEAHRPPQRRHSLVFFEPAAAIALLAGAVIVQLATQLPPRYVDFALGVVGIGIFCIRSRWRWVGLLLIGAAWTLLRADIALSHRLPTKLEGEDVEIVGVVRGLPQRDGEDAHFELSVESAQRDGASVPLSGIVRASWYRDAPELSPCQRWQLHLRLKRPRGMVDPGAFDFERYALSEGINATGYVREDSGNRAIGEKTFCVDRLRQRIVEGISATLVSGSSAHLLRALAFGDQHAMDEHEWAVARATGIPHLIAISGLHIALFAGFGVLLVRAFLRFIPGITLRWPAPLIEACASAIFASGYALIAGLGLPTRRALVMIAVILAANVARRGRASVQGLALAVIALLAWDPLCVLSAGFWLSFVGVAWLIFCLDGRGHHNWRDLVKAQGVATIGLLPLTIWFFGQSSLIGPIANLIAVPAICFFVLPITVVGALMQLIVPTIGVPLVRLAGGAMDLLWSALETIANWPGALWYFPEPGIWAFAFALVGAFWLLLPRGIPARALGLFLFLPLLFPARTDLKDGEFEVLMLDVGQGLAVVVRTREHTLLYDAGARFPSGFDLGDAVVVPTLHAIGVTKLDRLIVSHGDNDHAGGADSVIASFPYVAAESGEPDRLRIAAAQCLAGEEWTWDGVSFRVVHPSEPLSSRGNDRCCVLEVGTGDSAILLTGDITSAVESIVVGSVSASSSVLQVPHHGSKTSSSDDFLDALHPTLALVSAGYRNRFNHPNPEIVARYAAHGIVMLNTAERGFVHIRFGPYAPPRIVEQGRRDRHPYWRE